MFEWISRWRAGAVDIRAPAYLTEPLPLYAVGDVHGCLDLYLALERRIVADAKGRGETSATIVLLGDVVDRGPQSAQMLNLLMGEPPTDLRRICLCGNHEEMMADFLRSPGSHARWLEMGGRETLISYGVSRALLDAKRPNLRALSQALEVCVPDEHRSLLTDLPLGLEAGPYFLSHAGAAPGCPPADQPRRVLLWGDPRDLDRSPLPYLVVVHGHKPVDEGVDLGHRIAVDTGAYATGRLTAVRLEAQHPPIFLSVSGGS